MKPEEFINNISKEIQTISEIYYTGTNSGSEVSSLLNKLNITNEQNEILKKAINLIIKETNYNFIMGLEGNASIGESQEEYALLDNKGNKISGELSELFYENIIE